MINNPEGTQINYHIGDVYLFSQSRHPLFDCEDIVKRVCATAYGATAAIEVLLSYRYSEYADLHNDGDRVFWLMSEHDFWKNDDEKRITVKWNWNEKTKEFSVNYGEHRRKKA